MDRNFILAVALSMLVFTIWQSQQLPREPLPGEESPAAAEGAPRVPGADGSPAPVAPRLPAPSATVPGATVTPRSPAEALPPLPPLPSAPAWERVFEGKNYRVTVTNRGAALLGFELVGYDEWLDDGDKRPIDLLNSEEDRLQIATTPFEELRLGDLRTVNFEVEEERSDGVTFVLRTGGVTLRKRYDFDLEGFGFRLGVDLENDSGSVLQPRFAIEWPSYVREGNEYRDLSFVVRNGGEVERTPVASVGGSGFLGFGADSGEVLGKEEGVRWFGVDTRYFVAVLAPERVADARALELPIDAGRLATNVLFFDGISLPSGNSIRQELRGYVGPKLDDELQAFGSELITSVDRGWVWLEPLTRFFSWMLRILYGVVGNYGFAIILLTLLVRVVTTPIMQKQMKSMEKMRVLQPQMKELQEKYADDREKQSQELMKLYKETGVNPLGGCLPLILQMPVFIGLFYALQSSIELRHAPFILWMHDLSAPEALFMIPGIDIPFRVLPVMMAGSMVLQARLQPMSPDPSQAQMMQTVMPLMMLVLFYQFPSGLVLYYMLSNLLGIAHQRWVGRNLNK